MARRLQHDYSSESDTGQTREGLFDVRGSVVTGSSSEDSVDDGADAFWGAAANFEVEICNLATERARQETERFDAAELRLELRLNGLERLKGERALIWKLRRINGRRMGRRSLVRNRLRVRLDVNAQMICTRGCACYAWLTPR